MSDYHHQFMSLALQLAERGRGTVSPNPMVGCVIVKDNQVIGKGHHQCAGGAHAEIIALNAAGSNAAGADVYTTLEPCCHHGRTPPCTDALIRARVKTVYAACADPNPLVAGKGIAALQNAGIAVVTGVCEREAQNLNKIFFHYIKHRTPFVIAKWAMSLDGKTTTHPADSRIISSEASRAHTHQTRRHVDAILAGANTARQDNPALTARHGSGGRQPLRIILSSRGELPRDLQIFDVSSAKTLVAASDKITPEQRGCLLAADIDVIVLPASEEGYVSLPELMRELGRRNITSLLVEGGMTVIADFFRHQLVNQVDVYLAPVIIGAMQKKIVLQDVSMTHIDHDYYFSCQEINHV